MEEILDGGGSVMHEGRIITQKPHLPGDAELAIGNPEQEAATLHVIAEQIRRLQEKHDTITARYMPADMPPNTIDMSLRATGAGPHHRIGVVKRKRRRSS
jgi:hypothetical protein